jgi:hypothetical protein
MKATSHGENLLTEYNNRYISHPIEPTKSFKPPPNPAISDGPLSDKTTHRLDYVAHSMDRPYHHQAEMYKAPQGEMETSSVYKTEFVERKLERQGPAKRIEGRHAAGKFDGEPTYKVDYRKWEMPKLELSKANQQWKPPTEPFGAIPTYRVDFVPHQAKMQQSFKPDQTPISNETPFESVTDYRQSYVTHPLESKQIKEKVEYHRPHVPFEALSTFQRDYVAKEGGKMPSCKPNIQIQQSNEPLQSQTTMRSDYQTWEFSKPHLHQQGAYKKPEGDMEMATTYFRDFHELPLVKQAQIRRKDRKHGGDLPFEGNTDYRENFRQWEMGRRQLAGPRNEYMAPSVPFEGQSTFQSHYVVHPLDVRRSFKPDSQANISDEPFESGTIYRTEYTQKHIEQCPAATLDTARSQFNFQEQDTSGHKFYEPLASNMANSNGGRERQGSTPVVLVN